MSITTSVCERTTVCARTQRARTSRAARLRQRNDVLEFARRGVQRLRSPMRVLASRLDHRVLTAVENPMADALATKHVRIGVHTLT